jgi:hypothetical protein
MISEEVVTNKEDTVFKTLDFPLMGEARADANNVASRKQLTVHLIKFKN